VKLSLVTDTGFMPLLKVAAMAWLKGMPVALLAGLVEVTVGGVVSGAVPVGGFVGGVLPVSLPPHPAKKMASRAARKHIVPTPCLTFLSSFLFTKIAAARQMCLCPLVDIDVIPIEERPSKLVLGSDGARSAVRLVGRGSTGLPAPKTPHTREKAVCLLLERRFNVGQLSGKIRTALAALFYRRASHLARCTCQTNPYKSWEWGGHRFEHASIQGETA
jgi:hypothetical protein